jgi:DNA helicase-2/ATP-dependent DNA helicase PcrA
MSREYLKKLTQSQSEAVTYTGKHLMIVAGAGTGKTTVITSRIAYLIEQGVKPSQILALTFTDKAAREMEERVDQLLPYGVFGVNICTFHRFGEQILRQYGHTLGINEKTKVLTEVEQQIFLKNHITELPLKTLRPLSNPYNSVKILLKFFSTLKDNLAEPSGEDLSLSKDNAGLETDGISRRARDDNEEPDEDTREAVAAYPVYQELMDKNNLLDFGDLLNKTYYLIKNNKGVKAEITRQYKYILIDEFQDTNYAQIELMKLLVSPETSLTIVGDDDQSIYRFRGATVGQMELVTKLYPDTKIITLKENFRSYQEILDSAYSLITKNNPHRLEFTAKVNKKLISRIEKANTTSSIQSYAFNNDYEEAEWIINDIATHQSKRQLEDNCILVRSNAAAQIFIQKLTAANIAFTTKTEFGIADDPIVRALMNLFHVVTNPKEYLAFFSIATSPIYRIPSEVLVPIIANSRHTFTAPEENIEEAQIETFQALIDDIKDIRSKIHSSTTSEITINFVREKGHIDKYLDVYNNDEALIAASIVKFITICQRFESISREKTLLHFLESEDLLINDSEAIISENLNSGVNLLTIHSAKGLEYPNVYLTNMAEGRFPNIDRGGGIAVPPELIKMQEDDDEHIREERRLCYVAITRAKENLILTYAKFYNGGVRERKPSRFFAEMSPLQTQTVTKNAMGEDAKIDSESSPYKNKLWSIPIRSLEDYERCPYHFKLNQIDKVPTADSPNLQIGRIMHKVFESYFRSVIKGKPLTESELVDIFEAGFDPSGHESEKLRDLRRNDCLIQITNFYQRFNKFTKPTDIESDVAFKINGLTLKGRIDFLANTKDPVIVDFKTGSVKNEDKAREKSNDSLQIKTYAYYFFNQYHKMPRAALYFPSSDILSYAKIDEKVLAKTEEKIYKIISNIKAGNFKAKPNNIACQYCSTRPFCPYAS